MNNPVSKKRAIVTFDQFLLYDPHKFSHREKMQKEHDVGSLVLTLVFISANYTLIGLVKQAETHVLQQPQSTSS